jgi:hypothetical protein
MLEGRAAIALFRLQEQVAARALWLAAQVLSLVASGLVARTRGLVALELSRVTLRQATRHLAIDWAQRSLPALDPWRGSDPAPGPVSGPASESGTEQDSCCSLLTQGRWQAP